MPGPLLAQRPAKHDCGNPGQHWLAAMRAGDFRAAWAVSDAVLAARDPAGRDDPAQPYHLRWVWDGSDPAGRDVLVRCYHGLGDTLQFCRFLPLLRPLVRNLVLEVQPELMGLLRDLPGPDRLIPFQPDAPHSPSGCDVEIMELPHLLRAVPGPASYLHAVPAPRPAPGLLVGVCWQAGGWDPGRSVPLPLLAPLAALPGVRLVSLQRGPAAADAAVPGAPPLLLAAERGMDVAAAARLMMALDLVVTVDTMVAHLAGALGRPAHVLLQADADWRWMADRADSPWYPSLRLHRQAVQGDWRGPLAQLNDIVAEWASDMAKEP